MARRDSTPLSMTELCEYFKDRNSRIFKGTEDSNKEKKNGMKKMTTEEHIYQRNSRPSLRLQLSPQTNDPLYGNSVPIPPPFSPSQPRLGRSLQYSPLTPHSTSSSSGCSCCSSPPYDSSSRPEKWLRSPLTPQSTTSLSGCSCCSSTGYDPSLRPESRSQLSPFAMYSEFNYPVCCCYYSQVHEQSSNGAQGLPQSQYLSPYSSYSVPSSPYTPREVPRTFNHLGLLCSSNVAPCCQDPHSPYRQQVRENSRRGSFPTSPRPPSEDQLQPGMVRSLPCSPNIARINRSQGPFILHTPLLRKRQQMKNDNLLRKYEEELGHTDHHDDNDGKIGKEFFP